MLFGGQKLQLRQNDPCLLDSGEVGTTWLEFAPWAACSWFLLIPGAEFVSQRLGRSCQMTQQGGRVSAAAGGKAPEIYLLSLEEQGPWKMQVSGRCCMSVCVHALVHACMLVMCAQGGCTQMYVHVCTGRCIKAWKCAIIWVFQLALERVKSAMGEPETPWWDMARERKREVAPVDSKPPSAISGNPSPCGGTFSGICGLL